MQGLNFSIDSTYIQNTTQENVKPQEFEKSNSSISFMEILRKEIRGLDRAEEKSEVVQKTDTDVLKSSSDSNFEKTEKVADSGKDAGITQKTDEKEIVKDEKQDSKTENVAVKKDHKGEAVEESKKSSYEANQLLTQLIKSEKNQHTDPKVSEKEMKVSLEEKIVISSDEIELLKNEAETFSLGTIADEVKNVQLSKLENIKDEELLSSQFASVENPEAFLKNIVSKNDKVEEVNTNVKDVKGKKDARKLADVISVTDLRTQKPENVEAVKKSDFVTSVKQTSSDSVQVTMDLTSQAEKNILSMDTQSAAAQGSTFQAMLENQITENAADFVKAGNIVLKDNNVGKINLILHPESLGNVKISLELTDKVITGKIVVTSQEALKAFVSTQESLKAAFIESGFDSASFDVAFANQNQNFQSSNRDEQNNSRQAFKAYDDFVAENISVDGNNSDTVIDIQNYSINIVA